MTKKTDLEKADLKWLHPGMERAAHLYPGGTFTSLCGSRSGALNGGPLKARCKECITKSEVYVRRAETARAAREKRWLASKKRNQMLAKITAALVDMDNFAMGEVLGLIRRVQK